MQIPQPDLRIVPRKQDHTNSRTGPGPKLKHHKLRPAALMGHFNPTMRNNKNTQFTLLADEIQIAFRCKWTVVKRFKIINLS